MARIESVDKSLIKRMYFEKGYSIEKINIKFKHKYEYASIRTLIFELIEEIGEQYEYTK